MKREKKEQAEAELCQAQVKLGLAKSGQLVGSGIPTEAKFQVSLLSRGVGGGGWVREIENKAKLSPAGAGAWAELGKKTKYKLCVISSRT